MKIPALAMAVAGALVMAGCGKPPSGDQPSAGDQPAAVEPAPVAVAPEPQASPAPASSPATTNEALTGAAAFMEKSLASPFAESGLALKESFNRALIAFQIGDYARAASELRDLAADSDLTTEQKQAVHDLLAKTLLKAPELAETNTLSAQAAAPAEFALTGVQTGESPKNVPDSPFITADPAVRESFARAKAAFNIGDFENALSELQELATNSQLNFQQKYAVQSLIDKTPQAVPGVSSPPPGIVPKK